MQKYATPSGMRESWIRIIPGVRNAANTFQRGHAPRGERRDERSFVLPRGFHHDVRRRVLGDERHRVGELGRLPERPAGAPVGTDLQGPLRDIDTDPDHRAPSPSANGASGRRSALRVRPPRRFTNRAGSGNCSSSSPRAGAVVWLRHVLPELSRNDLPRPFLRPDRSATAPRHKAARCAPGCGRRTRGSRRGTMCWCHSWPGRTWPEAS